MTPQQIQQDLSNLPALIARATERAINAHSTLDKAEIALETLKAKTTLEIKAKYPNYKQYEVQASTLLAIETDRLGVILLEANAKREDNRVQELDNKFTATKKLVEVFKIEAFSGIDYVEKKGGL